MSEESKNLSALEILQLDDITWIDVFVEPWKTKVRIKTLQAGVAISFFKQNEKRSDGLVRIVQMSAINTDGSLMFNSNDIEKLKTKSMKAFQILQDAILKLNQLGKYAEDVKND